MHFTIKITFVLKGKRIVIQKYLKVVRRKSVLFLPLRYKDLFKDKGYALVRRKDFSRHGVGVTKVLQQHLSPFLT